MAACIKWPEYLELKVLCKSGNEKKGFLKQCWITWAVNFYLMREFPNEYQGHDIWRWLFLYCKCLFCYLICYIAARSSQRVIWWVSACAQCWMTDWRKASCFVPLRFWSISCRIQQGWKCFVNESLIWIVLGSSSHICLWNSVLTVFVWLCGKSKPFWGLSVNFVLMLANYRIQAILTDKSSSSLIPTLTVLTYLHVFQKKFSLLLLSSFGCMRWGAKSACQKAKEILSL